MFIIVHSFEILQKCKIYKKFLKIIWFLRQEYFKVWAWDLPVWFLKNYGEKIPENNVSCANIIKTCICFSRFYVLVTLKNL